MAQSFLQSKQWLEFLEREGQSVHGTAPTWQWAQRSLGPLGVFWYGAFVQGSASDVERIVEEARRSRITFLRVSPVDDATLQAICATVGEVKRVTDAQPSTSLVMDLRPSDDALLASFKTKTRYNIGVAQRHGVRVEIQKTPLNATVFAKVWSLYSDTAMRHGIRNHPREHYAQAPGEWALAWLGEELLNAHFCVGNDGVYTYLYGASSSEHKDVMASYLTQWETIRHAKMSGYVAYDFWGIAPTPEDVSHPYHGITRFKMGFGGAVVQYPGTFEIPIAPARYWLYRVAKAIRSFTRHK